MNRHGHFDAFARALHWSMAILILAMLFVGVAMVSSMTLRPLWPCPGSALSVLRETSSRIDTARSRFCGRVCRQIRSSSCPVA